MSRIIELSNFSSHGESRKVSGFMSRIIEFLSSHGESRRVSGFMSRIIELSNLFIHAEDHGGFLCHKTCSLSRICELVFFTRNVTDGCGGYEGGTIEA